MSLIRVPRTAQQTLSKKVRLDEALTDAGGSVTVVGTRLDGTAVAAATGTASDGAGPGAYEFVLPGGPASPASATWQLDILRITWTGSFGGATVTLEPDLVEVVGGHVFGVAEARDVLGLTSPANLTKYPTTLLAARRVEVEQECERICHRAFVPRFARVALTGRGRYDLVLPDVDIRTVRAVTVAGVAVDVAGLTWSAAGVVTRRGGVWPAGAQIFVEYEYGLDYPPEEIRSAQILRLRSKLGETTSAVPDRAVSYTVVEGAVFRLSTPSGERTGVPTVDGVYERWTSDAGCFA